MSSRPTLEEIASTVGVSAVTVSKVLRGQGRISKTMRESIRAEATRMGYHPNPHGVALAYARKPGTFHGTLALLIGHPGANPLTLAPKNLAHAHYPRLLAGAKSRAMELGYALDIFWAFSPHLSARRLDEVLATRAIGGLLLLALQPGELALDWSRYACVHLGIPEYSEVPFVFVDLFPATRRAFLHAYAVGCRRIGLVIDAAEHRLSEGRCLGACAAAHSVRPDAVFLRPLIVESNALSIPSFKRWVDEERPDAILFFRNRVPELCRASGLFKERPLQLIDLDLNTGEQLGVESPYERMGATGIEVLANRLQRSLFGLDDTAAATCVPGLWREGGAVLP